MGDPIIRSTANLLDVDGAKKISLEVLGSLLGKFTLLPRLKVVEGRLMEGQTYIIPAREFATAEIFTPTTSNAVTDDDIDINGVQMTTSNVMHNFKLNDEVSATDQFGERGGEQLIAESVRVLTKGVEYWVYKQLASDPNARAVNVTGQGNMKYPVLSRAKAMLVDSEWDDAGMLNGIVTGSGEESLLNEQEYSNAAAVGAISPTIDGKIIRNMSGFNVEASARVYDGKLDMGTGIAKVANAVTGALNANINASVTQLVIKTLSVPAAFRAGDVINIGTENILLRLESSRGATVTFQVIRGVNGTTAASHTADDAITVVTGKLNLLWHRDAAGIMFAQKNLFNNGPYHYRVEARDPASGLSLYMMQEPIVSRDGEWRLSASIKVGAKVLHNASMARACGVLIAPTLT